MKKLKYILAALLVLLTVGMPVAILSGCARHYTVNVSIVEGKGDVRKRKSNTNEDAVSVVGENDAESGTDFYYAVGPATHYEIWYVKENGEFVYSAAAPQSYKNRPDADGNLNLTLEVSKDSTIEVAFRRKTYTITFFYANPDHATDPQNEPEYLPLTNLSGDLIQVSAPSQQLIEPIEGIGSFGFKYWNADGVFVELVSSANTIQLNTNLKLYTSKSRAELKDLLNVSDSANNSGSATA